jgi:ribosomal protein L29
MDAKDSTETASTAHEASDPFKSRAALLVSVLAMVLAVASLGGSNAAKDATQHNILAANAYAFYQAKNIRQTAYKIAADQLEAELLDARGLNAEQRLLKKGTLDDYRKNIARYESEPETREGKKELMAIAKDHEQHRDSALRKDPWFDYAEALLQIGIVLASIAIITASGGLLYCSIAAGLVGMLSTFNGYLLFY